MNSTIQPQTTARSSMTGALDVAPSEDLGHSIFNNNVKDVREWRMNFEALM